MLNTNMPLALQLRWWYMISLNECLYVYGFTGQSSECLVQPQSDREVQTNLLGRVHGQTLVSEKANV